MAAYDDLMTLLKANRMEPVRNKKHQVWQHPDGRVFVMSSTPSDTHAVHQQMRSLRKFLGIARPKQYRNTERREKKPNHDHGRKLTLTPSTVAAKPTWQDQLAGAVERLRNQPPVAVEPAPKRKVRDFTPDVWAALEKYGVKIVRQS